MENKRLRYLLDPDQLTLLNLKLQTREITPEECRQMLKQMMISQYIQRHSLSATLKNTVFVRGICKIFSSLKNKIFMKTPAEPTIGTEELSCWFRPRHL
jgi:hypothetical protein